MSSGSLGLIRAFYKVSFPSKFYCLAFVLGWNRSYSRSAAFFNGVSGKGTILKGVASLVFLVVVVVVSFN